jgi:hypothetical protein
VALNPINEIPAISLRFFRGTLFDPPRAVIKKRIFIEPASQAFSVQPLVNSENPVILSITDINY